MIGHNSKTLWPIITKLGGDIDLKMFLHVLLIVLYKKASSTTNASITDFLLICMMLKTVK